MSRIKALNYYQKSILLILMIMLIIFTIAYPIVTSRQGYAYREALLIPNEENGSIIYSGRYSGNKLSIAVAEDHTVTFFYGESAYGPYVARRDQSALPENNTIDEMTGVEILQGNTVIFRGGVMKSGGYQSGELTLINEDGTLNGFSITYTGEDGIERDAEGNPLDLKTPTPTEILELLAGPKLTNKGDWQFFLIGIVISLLTGWHILYADELFRRKLSFHIKDAEKAEPSEFEIAARYIVWTVFAILVLICNILGLTV